MKARLGPQFAGAVLITALLLMYLVLTSAQAIRLIASGKTQGVVMGAALFLLPLIALGGVIAEWVFAFRVSQLEKLVNQEDSWPELELELKPSGRPTRKSADAAYEKMAAVAEAAPADWHSWFNLSLAYDAAGDRRRARSSMRKAIALTNFESKATALRQKT